MTLPNSAEVFRRLIDDLESSASCARQLAFLRDQPLWFKVDEMILKMRQQIIQIAEAKDKEARGLIIRPN